MKQMRVLRDEQDEGKETEAWVLRHANAEVDLLSRTGLHYSIPAIRKRATRPEKSYSH